MVAFLAADARVEFAFCIMLRVYRSVRLTQRTVKITLLHYKV